jgi:hypothetical protein
MLKASGYEVVQKEPAYCIVHDQFAPCMYCLLPEVYAIVKADSLNKLDFYFMACDENAN